MVSETIMNLTSCLEHWDLIVALYELREQNTTLDVIRGWLERRCGKRVGKPVMSKWLKVLSEYGIVESIEDPEDRRIKRFKLTSKGEALYTIAQELITRFERLERREKKRIDVDEAEVKRVVQSIKSTVEESITLQERRKMIESELTLLIGKTEEYETKRKEHEKVINEQIINSHKLQHLLEKLRTYIRLEKVSGVEDLADEAIKNPEKYSEVLRTLFDEAYLGVAEKAGAKKLRDLLKRRWSMEKERFLQAIEKTGSERGLMFLIEDVVAIDQLKGLLKNLRSKSLKEYLCRSASYLYDKIGVKAEELYEHLLEDEDLEVRDKALQALLYIEGQKRPY